jgi:hypothetical protein
MNFWGRFIQITMLVCCSIIASVYSGEIEIFSRRGIASTASFIMIYIIAITIFINFITRDR